jgi:hypothetical protein
VEDVITQCVGAKDGKESVMECQNHVKHSRFKVGSFSGSGLFVSGSLTENSRKTTNKLTEGD